MVIKKREGSLSAYEKKIVKGLLAKNWRNQDIQALVNVRRIATINSARITEVKQNSRIKSAKDNEIDFYLLKKKSYDPQTGLNFYDDERLIRARESMILAVQIFNSPSMKFKTEVFAVLVNIAWTYLLHEHYEKKGVPIMQDDGRSLLLSKMLKRQDCPLSKSIIDNLNSIKTIRDSVEHTLFRKGDLKWLSIFQACCLNFEKTIVTLFGEETTLKNDLSFSLQFSKLDFDQITELQKYDLPANIDALDAQLATSISEESLTSLEYKFRVVYTFENSTKSKSHIKFVLPEDVDADEIKNVLVKHENSDKLYPYKAKQVMKLVQQKSSRRFSSHNHTQAWKKFKIRPATNAKQPEDTNTEYCHYHTAHKDYTYSEHWVTFLVDTIADEQSYKDLIAYRSK